MKHVCLLGATGSIGSQVLEIMEQNPNQYQLVAFSFGKNLEQARLIIKKFQPKFVVSSLEEDMKQLAIEFPNVEFAFGDEAISLVASFPCENPVVINALVGSVGCLPTASAIKAKRDVLLANKETLVMAGEIIMNLAKEMGVRIIPIDSEHVALTQILYNRNINEVKRLILTASGGPFRNLSRQDLKYVTKEEALHHPNWKMGAKITIDSATMMNKGFEIIEAYHLFGLPIEKVDAIIHRESIIHSLVEFQDHSLLAQMAVSDMRIPIQYALSFPKHVDNHLSKDLRLEDISSLSFEKLNEDRFRTVHYAKEALKKGGFYPTALNACNEALVHLFLNDEINFYQIDEIMDDFLNDESLPLLWKDLSFNLNNIMKVDQLVKNKIERLKR